MSIDMIVLYSVILGGVGCLSIYAIIIAIRDLLDMIKKNKNK